ncbi:hypothetical protein V2J09_022750 [Rumex salicifolius]
MPIHLSSLLNPTHLIVTGIGIGTGTGTGTGTLSDPFTATKLLASFTSNSNEAPGISDAHQLFTESNQPWILSVYEQMKDIKKEPKDVALGKTISNLEMELAAGDKRKKLEEKKGIIMRFVIGHRTHEEVIAARGFKPNLSLKMEIVALVEVHLKHLDGHVEEELIRLDVKRFALPFSQGIPITSLLCKAF